LKRVLFDSDVLLDVLAQRQPFVVDSAQALALVGKKKVQGYVSGHAITNIFYILRREVGSEVARDALSRLLEQIQVAGVTDEVIRQALLSPVKDFEDAVVSAVANVENIEVIVTRNISDFKNSSVPAMLPADFLENS
jgi:predicted nucleic acid-binding protein